jgi:hypothetical protein
MAKGRIPRLRGPVENPSLVICQGGHKRFPWLAYAEAVLFILR